MSLVLLLRCCTQVKLLVAADMGDVNATLNTSTFDTYDPTTLRWSKTIPCPPLTQTRNKFTIASCQFAMHYMFQNLQRANHFFQQVSSNLILGGVLIATTVDARVVANMAVKLDSEAPAGPRNYKKDLSIYADPLEEDENIAKQKKNHQSDSEITSSSASSCPLMMNIHFDDQNWNKLLNIHTDTEANIDIDPFGIRYIFTLVDDPAKGNAVDAPEWLVPTGAPLRELAAKHGLEVDYCQNFHDFVNDKMTTDLSLRF